jgi:hypothetical protein
LQQQPQQQQQWRLNSTPEAAAGGGGSSGSGSSGSGGGGGGGGGGDNDDDEDELLDLQQVRAGRANMSRLHTSPEQNKQWLCSNTCMYECCAAVPANELRAL